MRLITIAESYLGKLTKVAESLGIPQNKLEANINEIDPSGKYGLFILRLIANKNVRIPEDNTRIKEAIDNFSKYKRKLAIKDINKYNILHDIEVAVEPYIGSQSKRKGGLDIDILSLPGVKVINRYNNFTTVSVVDVESLKQIGEGTKWCTRGSYANCQADSYLQEHDVIYVVLQGNVPIIQYTPDFDQVMDRNDVLLSSSEPIAGIEKIIPLEKSHKYQEAKIEGDYESMTTIMLDYALNVIQGELPEEYENYISRNPHAAYYYAKQFKGRWSEAEPVIMQTVDSLVYYAASVLKRRWFEAEPQLLGFLENRTPYNAAGWAVLYAKLAVKGRWLEGEPYIINSLDKVHEYRDFLKQLNPSLDKDFVVWMSEQSNISW